MFEHLSCECKRLSLFVCVKHKADIFTVLSLMGAKTNLKLIDKWSLMSKQQQNTVFLILINSYNQLQANFMTYLQAQ